MCRLDGQQLVEVVEMAPLFATFFSLQITCFAPATHDSPGEY